jgi:S-DNA-T family DNA segregation ATPase FtsK/SpoIIIE
LVVGAARSGRTGFLATVALGAAAARSPDELQLYIVDAAGALADVLRGLPHVGTSLTPRDLGSVPALLTRLERAVADRRGEAAGASASPAMLLIVDGWDALLARLDDATAARCGDQLAALIRSGSGVGLSTVVTGDRSLLAPRFAGLFGERLLLRLSDRGDYAMAGVALRAVPTELPPGRGVRASDGAEIQVAHVGASPDSEQQREIATQIGAQWQRAGTARDVIRIRSLPDLVGLADLPEMRGRIVLGLGSHAAEPLAIDPFAGSGRLLVAGPPRSGRSTALAAILAQAHRAGLAAIVAATARSPLVAQARECAVRVIDPDDDPDAVGVPPAHRVLLLVDDSERFVETAAGERLTGWLRLERAPLAAIVAGRAEDLATCYRGIGAEVRRSRCGLLLRPGPLDGELLGVRLPRQPATGPPGRGVLVGEPAWGRTFADGEPVPIQVARP